MSLSRKFKAIVGSVAAAGAIGGGTYAIVANTAPPPTPLQGHTALATLPQSGATVKQMTVEGSKLKSNTGYSFNNVSVKIEGNVPVGDHITGSNGQLLVTGNVGNNVNITVNVPEFQQYVPDVCTGMMMAGKVMIPYTYNCSYYQDTGPKPPFTKDPTIVVEGKTGQNVTLAGSTGIKVAHHP